MPGHKKGKVKRVAKAPKHKRPKKKASKKLKSKAKLRKNVESVKVTRKGKVVYKKMQYDVKKRKGPAISATLVSLGTVKKGNDGKMWITKTMGNTQRWVHVK